MLYPGCRLSTQPIPPPSPHTQPHTTNDTADLDMSLNCQVDWPPSMHQARRCALECVLWELLTGPLPARFHFGAWWRGVAGTESTWFILWCGYLRGLPAGRRPVVRTPSLSGVAARWSRFHPSGSIDTPCPPPAHKMSGGWVGSCHPLSLALRCCSPDRCLRDPPFALCHHHHHFHNQHAEAPRGGHGCGGGGGRGRGCACNAQASATYT